MTILHSCYILVLFWTAKTSSFISFAHSTKHAININSTEVDPHSNSLHNGIVKPKNIVNMMKTKNLFKALFINSI